MQRHGAFATAVLAWHRQQQAACCARRGRALAHPAALLWMPCERTCVVCLACKELSVKSAPTYLSPAPNGRVRVPYPAGSRGPGAHSWCACADRREGVLGAWGGGQGPRAGGVPSQPWLALSLTHTLSARARGPAGPAPARAPHGRLYSNQNLNPGQGQDKVRAPLARNSSSRFAARTETRKFRNGINKPFSFKGKQPVL